MLLVNSLKGKTAAPYMTGNGITTIQVSASYPDSYEIGVLKSYSNFMVYVLFLAHD